MRFTKRETLFPIGVKIALIPIVFSLIFIVGISLYLLPYMRHKLKTDATSRIKSNVDIAYNTLNAFYIDTKDPVKLRTRVQKRVKNVVDVAYDTLVEIHQTHLIVGAPPIAKKGKRKGRIWRNKNTIAKKGTINV